jgi:hypothetical protein
MISKGLHSQDGYAGRKKLRGMHLLSGRHATPVVRLGEIQMLETSGTVSQELPLSHREPLPPRRDHKRSDENQLKKATQNRLNYRSRKAVGLCSYGRCPAKAEFGHTCCRKHLQAMSKRRIKRCKERLDRRLCVYCGKRPQFWGRKCIICRQLFAENVLPRGAKRALRLYREAEARLLHQQIENDARAAALELLSSKSVECRWAEALRLYAGIDNGKWRTYDEVGQLMSISKERVRQLLLPSKVTLATILGHKVPWRPVPKNLSRSS